VRGRKILAVVVGALVVVSFVSFVVEMFFRHQVGKFHEVVGIVQSFGSIPSPGSTLHGASSLIATIKLADGSISRASVSSGLQLQEGMRVAVKAYPQNFGTPRYEIVSISSQVAP
jgi:hypothetical protein